MKGRLHNLLEALVAVAQEDARRREFARRVFAVPAMADQDLEAPACWRRELRVRHLARRRQG